MNKKNFDSINADLEKLKEDVAKAIPMQDYFSTKFKIDLLMNSIENDVSVILSLLADVKK